MRGFRWAQTANYGTAPNPLMPNVFVSEAYDLADPWNTPECAALGCCVAKTEKLGMNCTQDHRGEWDINGTLDSSGLGPLHPRTKKELGARLAQGLYASTYDTTGTMIGQGPVFVGCAKAGSALTLKFNSSRLRGERVTFSSTATAAAENTALYVLVKSNQTIDRRWISANHHTNVEYAGPYEAGNEMGYTGWRAVVAKAGSAPNELVIDLAQLGLTPAPTILAVRYAAGEGFNNTRMCCGPLVDTRLQPCPMQSCPLKATGLNTLPAVPFFAEVTAAGKCACFSPQVCDE